MATSKQLLSILDGMKKDARELESKTIVFDEDENGSLNPIVSRENETLSDYDKRILQAWKKQEQDRVHSPAEPERVIQLPPKKPSMMFLPLLLAESWMPLRGNHISYQRFNRGIKITSASDYYDGDHRKPIHIPSGLLARRILLALVSRSVVEKSRFIEVGSVTELLKDSGLTKTGAQSRRIQKTLFQMFMTSVKIWDYRQVDDGEQPKSIHNGSMFDDLFLDPVKTNQEKFSFIPEKVVFKESFYNDVIDGGACPFLTDDILKASGALEHDVLLWLFNRQTQVSKKHSKFIGYGVLYHQFGQPNQQFKHFKSEFKKLMRMVREKHERKVEVHSNGLILSFMPNRVPAKNERRIRL
jgi:hypothetical protein